MDRVDRKFVDVPAERGSSPLMVGLSGPSGGGKTYSALRLATGMRRVVGGEIWFIDTEGGRALYYAKDFTFRHVPFAAPFSPLDYLAAVEHCVDKGAKIIIVDSMTHEHEGEGGVKDEHDQEVKRLMKAWNTTEDKANAPAWARPKKKRMDFLQRILQMQVNFIFCFRAKEKVKLGGGKVTQMGFMPLAGDEYVYEMVCNALLMPNADGVPTWNPIEIGEKQMVKLPRQFREYFKAGRQFDEDAGEFMAQWAANAPATKDPSARATEMVKAYSDCDLETFRKLEAERELIWKKVPTDQKTIVKTVSDLAKARLGVTT